MKLYQVKAQRSGGWWALSVAELPGVHSQAKSLHQAESFVKEAISLATDEDPADIAVVINPALPKTVMRKVLASRQKVTALQRIQEETATLSREAARALLDSGLSQRDAATVLGVSYQRVSQLSAGSGASRGSRVTASRA